MGDYVRLRQNPQWKKICIETNDQYVVFADIINKITRTGGKVKDMIFTFAEYLRLIFCFFTTLVRAYLICDLHLIDVNHGPADDGNQISHPSGRDLQAVTQPIP